MVLIYVVYRRRRESTVRYAGPDDDVRENIIEHEDESGGEDDITATLQIPIGDQGLGLGLGYDTMKESKIPWKFVFPLKRPIQFGEWKHIFADHSPAPMMNGEPSVCDFIDDQRRRTDTD